MKTYTYNIYSPGGNDTALVIGIPKSQVDRKQINNTIMSQNPNVEQVGFIKNTPSYRLVMAGGEFCGNATRSTAYLILRGKPGQILIQLSGTKQTLKAGVDKNGNAWTQIPLSQNNLIQSKSGFSLVNLEGISQVITPFPRSIINQPQLKRAGLKILQQLNLTTTVPAAGVTFYSQTPKGIQINPVVWVRNIQTLFCETACGSATAALGIITALNSNKSVVNLPIIQPTNQIISVSTFLANRSVKAVTISSPIQIISTNKKLTLKVEKIPRQASF